MTRMDLQVMVSNLMLKRSWRDSSTKLSDGKRVSALITNLKENVFIVVIETPAGVFPHLQCLKTMTIVKCWSGQIYLSSWRKTRLQTSPVLRSHQRHRMKMSHPDLLRLVAKADDQDIRLYLITLSALNFSRYWSQSFHLRCWKQGGSVLEQAVSDFLAFFCFVLFFLSPYLAKGRNLKRELTSHEGT